MQLPGTVQIGPFKYEVAVIDDMLLQHNLMGQQLAHRALIKVASGMTQDQLTQTFLHEIMHAIDFAYNLNLEEDDVNRLATCLLDVIQRNGLDFRRTYSYD